MKRFTLLTMLVALFSIVAFAQKGTKLRPMAVSASAPRGRA